MLHYSKGDGIGEVGAEIGNLEVETNQFLRGRALQAIAGRWQGRILGERVLGRF